MSFSLASKVNNIEGDTSFLLGKLQDLATNAAVAASLSNYLTAVTCDARFAPIDNPTFTGAVGGSRPQW